MHFICPLCIKISFICPELNLPCLQISFHRKCLMSAWPSLVIQQLKLKKVTSKPPHTQLIHPSPRHLDKVVIQKLQAFTRNWHWHSGQLIQASSGTVPLLPPALSANLSQRGNIISDVNYPNHTYKHFLKGCGHFFVRSCCCVLTHRQHYSCNNQALFCIRLYTD